MGTTRLGAPMKRAPPNSDGNGKQKAVIILVSIAAALMFGVLFFFILRSLRLSNAPEAQGRKKRTWFWRLRSSLPTRRNTHTQLSTVEVQNASRDPEAVPDRHASIRSVATLPAYSAVPREGEGVIGREGDREGMDTVLEFPESVDEQESRRDAEMESLWRIRQQRRTEAAEREERRRRRREARARGDHATLNAIRVESMARSTYQQNNGSNAMIAEHQSRPRERKVSAVNYGDLGVARHDGSRVRANSNESDSRPLLDNAAGDGMAGPARPWLSRESFSTHHRQHSATSFSSLDSDGPDPRGNEFETISLQQTRSRPHSNSLSTSLRRPSTQIQTVDSDLGESRIPLPDPPQYDAMGFEEAPPYEQIDGPGPSLSLDQASDAAPPQLPAIDRLPSIRITESSPIEPPNLPRLGSTRSRTTTAPTIHEETN